MGLANTDSKAIEHSRNRLEKARAALVALESAADLDAADSAWTDLLLAASAIFSKLEQGSKVKGGAAQGWYGRMKKQRKDDPLLSYAHHARNSVEHGIEDVAKKMPAGSALLHFHDFDDPAQLEGQTITIGKDIMGHVRVRSSTDLITTKEFPTPELVLVTVTDTRYNDTFDPPTEHLGKPIQDARPAAIGKLLIDYLGHLIDEAVRHGI